MKYLLDTNIVAYIIKRRPIEVLHKLQSLGALSHGLILVTNNVKEFERVSDLQIENWITNE